MTQRFLHGSGRQDVGLSGCLYAQRLVRATSFTGVKYAGARISIPPMHGCPKPPSTDPKPACATATRGPW
jgi:hypothetical protein